MADLTSIKTSIEVLANTNQGIAHALGIVWEHTRMKDDQAPPPERNIEALDYLVDVLEVNAKELSTLIDEYNISLVRGGA
ncbi:hypothetical protein G4F99_06540 [Hafnia paralvei]|uniref:hypothetical protein n=1 Tax=Hafnia paralvei TaxID=546367 RepID=UPI001585AB49|nr:hypothetical protein [Hafnia paralvei]NUN41269.1 hypothetical protein [Hafnia paralvei]